LQPAAEQLLNHSTWILSLT